MPAGPDHRHCRVCGKVTAPGEETCSPECAAKREARIRTGRNYRYLLYGLIAILLLLFLSPYLR